MWRRDQLGVATEEHFLFIGLGYSIILMLVAWNSGQCSTDALWVVGFSLPLSSGC